MSTSKKTKFQRAIRKVQKLFFSMNYLEARDMIHTFIILGIFVISAITTIIGYRFLKTGGISRKAAWTIYITGLSVLVVSMCSTILLFLVATIEKNRLIRLCKITPTDSECSSQILNVSKKYAELPNASFFSK